MNNPFDTILSKLSDIEQLIMRIPPTIAATPPEIINTEELCKRIGITEPTAIKWRRKGKIPFIEIGTSIRYNWPDIINKLEK